MASRAEEAPVKAGRKSGAQAILKAAEKLFGVYGIDGVSIRQINIAAGMANNSAVTYHFGDKMGLLRAILMWRKPQLMKAAAVEYARVEAEGRLNDPVGLFEIMMRPYLTIVDEDGHHVHAAFMQHIVRWREGRSLRVSIWDSKDPALKALTLLRKSLPDLPPELVSFRLRVSTVAYFDALMEWDRGPVDPKFPQYGLEDMVREMFGLAGANFARPSV